MEVASFPYSSLSSSRTWRTAFLTLRDEVLTSPASSTMIPLLHRLIFSQSETLIAAVRDLPPHEVTSDAMFLVELGRTLSDCGGDVDDMIIHTFTQLSYLIYNLSQHVTFEITSSSWTLLLDSFGRMVETFLGKACLNIFFSGNVTVIKATKYCLDTVRCVLHVLQRTSLLSENTQLLDFLLSVVSCSQDALTCSSSSGNWRCAAESGKMVLEYNSLWEVQTTAFAMISDVFTRVGTCLSVDHWKLTIEVFRKVMDALASKGLLVEGIVMDRFYASLLQCLHLVLINAKGSLSNQVAGFIATLRVFFNYGLTSKSPIVSPVAGHSKDVGIASLTSCPAESNRGPYRPPHLRKKNQNNLQLADVHSLNVSDHESATFDHMSSDSDLSDNDGSLKDVSNFCSHKARVAAIICIQISLEGNFSEGMWRMETFVSRSFLWRSALEVFVWRYATEVFVLEILVEDLCRADPKSFTGQWTMLLPASDVLQARRYEATLMTCLLFDPYLKVRLASASTLGTMLEEPASVFLQIAEYKESSKCGSFMALSSSLGQILMQVHTGVLHLIKHESHSGLLASLFKILMLLISATPYARMPVELLPTVILNLRERIGDGFTLRTDQTGMLAVAINCLTTALSTSPPSMKVKDIFMMELSRGFVEVQGTSGVLSTLFLYSRPVTNPTISIEALQALKAVAHNYPDIVVVCWEQVSSIISGYLCLASPEVTTRPWKVNAGNIVGAIGEKVITSTIKVLDECLRAVSGFKGTEDLSDDKILDSPFTSDYVKIKTISSAPSYGSENPTVSTIEHPSCLLGREQWCEAIEKHMPSTLFHSSAMVRAASITCFAGITSAVFFSLPIDKQDSIITHSIGAALNDEVPSVRSAACRSIGVIACFPQVFRSAEILGKFIHAAEVNTRDSLVSVRITASWALANICDSLRHCINRFASERCLVDLKDCSQLTSLLIDCSLRLTRDNDKVKANAVRALGNLSRFVQCSSQSSVYNWQDHRTSFDIMKNGRCMGSNLVPPPSWEDSRWLEGMVQAFLSCVTTGNVKVRWNVCHALSNLFLNETLKLQDMDWAPSVFSILLLLLRDSSNFKIRIQAAAALAVPPTILDYGRLFSDVVQGVENTLENLSSDQIAAPASFKYRVALEKQLTSTMLHVLGLASRSDHQPVQDFLIKKASFLEEWIQVLCTSLGDATTQLDAEYSATRNHKKQVILKAVQSLMAVYDTRNHHGIARRFDKLVNRIP